MNCRKRVNWNEYFMQMAEVASTRATCDRLHVGAVLVKDRRILATGYNGSAAGLPHCDDVDHMMADGHCIATIHAEINAIVSAAKNGVAIDGADCYVNWFPCWNCFKTLATAGIKNIYFRNEYGKNNDLVWKAAKDLNMGLTKLEGVEVCS